MKPIHPVDRQLTALADPTRRAIYDIVRTSPSSVGAVAARVPVSQPAVSQHLRVLVDAQLVTATQSGAKRIYRADREGLQRLRSWIDQLWDDVLDAFVDAATEQHAADGTSGQPTIEDQEKQDEPK